MTHTMILECSNGKKLKRNPNACSSSMMGKPQKIFKRYSSGNITDYKHSVEVVEEMDGCSSSCRVDSETSCTPKKKCSSRNVEQHNILNVPVQHFPTSSMSVKELKELKMRLRGELEKVRTFQMKTLSRANGSTLSSSRDGHAKKSSLKKGISDKFEAPKPIPSTTTGSAMFYMKQCESVIKNLMHHKYCRVFSTPVDVVKLKIPDYYSIIKQPMDLGTVKKKLASGSYSNPSDFAYDVRLTFANAMNYNPPGNDFHIMADALRKVFEKKWKPIADKLVETDYNFKKEREFTKAEPLAPSKKSKSIPMSTKEEPVLFSKKRKSPPMSIKAEPLLSSKKRISHPLSTKAEPLLSSKKRPSSPLSKKAEPLLSSKKRPSPPLFTKAEPLLSSKKRPSPPLSTKAEPLVSSKKRPSPPLSTKAEPVLSSKKRPSPLSTKAEPLLSSKNRTSPPLSTKAEPVSSSKKRISPPKEKLITVPKIEKQKMPYSEKYTLSNQIQAYQQDLPDHIVDFLRQQINNGKSCDEEIEIDIESLDDDILYKLQKLMDDYFGIKKPALKADIKNCETEVLVESGVSTLSVPCQVNEPVVDDELADEEIDIGGDESDVPPIVNYPPLEIEEDIAPKCSSSSSSSSDSGSSSDSDSDSSSESDSDASTPTISGKENGKHEVSKSPDKFNSTSSADPAINIDEPTDGIVSSSFKTEECQDGNNVSKKQSSPDKRYRAALLKSRFADTIFKAHEKTLGQGVNNDPEKLRREREKLEQQKKEEKAKIEAEAKAAENARKQQAAAEAKRKRELEREAARQALQQMKKTVDMNENTLFLNDYELLGAGHAERAPSTIDGRLDVHSFGGFNLAGSKNPLEQLGLFRKDDDEEEDFVQATIRPNDVEEGEID